MTLWRMDRDMPVEEMFLRAALDKIKGDEQDNG